MNEGPAGFARAMLATIGREWLSHRVNRFLHWHLGLLALAGVAAVLIAPEGEANGVAWFLLYAVLYVISLSAVLLGLSSAQAENDETPFLLTQPTGVAPWVAGKAAGLALIVAPSSVLLIVPWWITGGWTPGLAPLVWATAGFSVVLTTAGLAVGLWIHEPVRGLIAAVALWFAWLFATDLLLILIAGAGWVQSNPSVWVAPLMLNPFDALRVTVLLTIERAAFNSLGSGALVAWWTEHASAWLIACLTGWAALAWSAALVAARRRRQG